MLNKRNLFFLSLFILGILLLSSCFLNPPATEGILKGQIMVPEGTTQTKDLTGQALPDATVNIIDLTTGAIIATTVTDATGHYQVSVPPGGSYLLEAVKGSVKLEQITCSVEVGIEYDLGTADCVTTAAALIAQAMMDAGDNPADINCADIIADPNFDDVSSIVCSTIKAGGDPTTSALVQQAVEDFLNPPAPTPTPTPTYYTVTFDSQGGSTVNSKAVEPGEKVSEPTDPTRTGYTFSGWYKESGYTNAWDFDTDTVTTNVTLYAQWIINTYTVTFDSHEGSAVSPITDIPYNTTITLPTAPTKESNTFAGWFSDDPTFLVPFTASTPVTADITLYAKWIDPVHDITKGIYYPTIQLALDAADSVNGDTIEVDEGTYDESITFPAGRLIILQSLNGASPPTITGVDGSAIVTCTDSLEDTTLKGFMIMHNSGDSGRGIAITAGYLTINNCTISGNSTTSGGGIDNYGTLDITGSTISGNSADYHGGGIENYDGTLTITDSTISGNSAPYGGGIYNYGTLDITGGTISDNTANDGGGIYLTSETEVTIGGSGNFNTFTNNKKVTTISADQHIRKYDDALDSVDCHWDYLDNDYSPAEVTSYKLLVINNSALLDDLEGNINPTDRTISLTVPSGTDLTGLKATFTLVTGASAKVGTTSQESGTTSNDFTIPVTYTVFKTTEPSKITNWTVTVTVSP